MVRKRAALEAWFVDLCVLSRFLVISEFHVLIFVQFVTDLAKYLRLAVSMCVSNKILNKIYSILLRMWQQWMEETIRQPLQTEQGLTENLNLSYEYPMNTVYGHRSSGNTNFWFWKMVCYSVHRYLTIIWCHMHWSSQKCFSHNYKHINVMQHFSWHPLYQYLFAE